MIVVAVLNATYFAHKDFFGVWNCSVVLRYKGQDSIIFFFPVGGRPVYVLQISLPRVGCQQKIWVASLCQMCFELYNVSLKSFFFKAFLCSWWMTCCVIRVLECLCWFEMDSDVEN